MTTAHSKASDPPSLAAAAVVEFLRAAGINGPAAAMAALCEALRGQPVETWIDCARRLIQQERVPAGGALLEAALRRWPDDYRLRYWLGNARRLAGDRSGAEQLYRRVLAEQPGFEDAALSLAFLLRDWARFSAAAEVALELRRRQGSGVEASLRCARFLKECRRIELAAEVCEETLAAGHADHGLLMFAGSMAMSLGRFELARQRFEAAAVLRPDDYDCWFQLCHAQRYDDAAHPDLPRFRAAWADEGAATRDRALAGFALGKACDDLGDFAAAAAVFRQANAMLAVSARWDPGAWRGFVDAAVQLRLPALREPVFDGIVPVFVIGLPRTGTTLVAERLGRGAGVRNRDELNWIEYIFSSLMSRNQVPDSAALRQAAAMYLSFLREDDAPARWYVDKNPLNFRHLPLIDALFPNARVIHCRRNLRDTALSIWMQHFAHADNDYAYDFANIEIFAAGYRRLMDVVVPRLRIPILELDYEQLVAEPERSLAAIRDFVGIAERSAGEEQDRPQAIATASVWQARQPVYRRSLDRWRAYESLLPELQRFPLKAADASSSPGSG